MNVRKCLLAGLLATLAWAETSQVSEAQGYIGGGRGWVSTRSLQSTYGGSVVPLYSYGAQIGLPIITFSLLNYWDSYYRNRPFYRERPRWEQRWHGYGAVPGNNYVRPRQDYRPPHVVERPIQPRAYEPRAYEPRAGRPNYPQAQAPQPRQERPNLRQQGNQGLQVRPNGEIINSPPGSSENQGR